MLRIKDSRTVITGIGLVSPIASGAAEFWTGLRAGASGIGEIRDFDPGPGAPRMAATVGEFPARDFVPAALARRMDRLSKMIATASLMAAADAGLDGARGAEERGVVVGSALGNMTESAQFLERVFTKGPSLASPMLFPNLVMNAPASQVSIALGWRGANLTVCEGELSGEAALEAALGILNRGRARAVIAAAGDELASIVFRALKDFGYLSPRGGGREWSSPFDENANGPVAGEGAAALLLEPEEEATARRARVYAVVEGVRRVRLATRSPYLWPQPSGPLAIGLEDRPELVLSGADSSPERDRLELALVSELAGESTPIVSLKGTLGDHGSFGLTNVAAAALSLHHGEVPPMPCLERPRRGLSSPRERLAGIRRRALVVGCSRGGGVAAIDLSRGD